jgi:hypothetical protein
MATPTHLQAAARCHLLLQGRCQHIHQLLSGPLVRAAGWQRLRVLFLLLLLLLLLLLQVGRPLLLLLLCAGVAVARRCSLVCGVSCQLKQVPQELHCLQGAGHTVKARHGVTAAAMRSVLLWFALLLACKKLDSITFPSTCRDRACTNLCAELAAHPCSGFRQQQCRQHWQHTRL